MARRCKAGQTEDVFADLIPGIIIIVITIFILGGLEATSSASIKLAADKDLKKLYSFDRISMLRSPVTKSIAVPASDATVGDLLVMSGDYMLGGSVPTWFSQSIVKNNGECGDAMYNVIDKNIGDYAFEWEVVMNKGATKVFSCEKTQILDEASKIAPFILMVPGVGFVGNVALKYGVRSFINAELDEYVTEESYVLPSRGSGDYTVKVKVKFFGFK